MLFDRLRPQIFVTFIGPIWSRIAAPCRAKATNGVPRDWLIVPRWGAGECFSSDGILKLEVGMFERITFDPNIMGGRACIRGMRIPVSVIVGQIAHGADFDEILEGYPDLEREDIQQAIEYAAWLAQEQVHTS